jgi:small subunit ribosomal protein S21
VPRNNKFNNFNSGKRWDSKPKEQPKGLTVEVRNNDVTKALRIFKKKVQEAGIIQEVREREYYEKPCEKKAEINRNKKNLAKRKNDLGF